MIRKQLAAVLMAAAIFGSGIGATVAVAAPAAEEKTGIKVGETAPDFTLKNQAGEEVSLAELTKKGPVALFFTRSAEW